MKRKASTASDAVATAPVAKPSSKKKKKTTTKKTGAVTGDVLKKDASAGKISKKIKNKSEPAANKQIGVVAAGVGEQKKQEAVADGEAASEAGASEMTKKEQKRKLGMINQKMKELAQNKQLGLCLKEWKRLGNMGLSPSIISFTNIINACVRCGEVQRALVFLKQLQASGLQANEVTYTVIVKGLVNDGRMGEARGVLKAMRARGCPPNIRTYDTVLRGCVRHGDVPMAKFMFTTMASEQLAPSQASFEALMRVLCSNLQIDLAWKVISQMEAKSMLVCSPALGHLARACALAGRTEDASKALAIADLLAEQAGEVKHKFKYELKQLKKEERSRKMFEQNKQVESKLEAEQVREYLSTVGERAPLAAAFGPKASLPRVRFLPQDPPVVLDLPAIFKDDKPVCLEVCSGSGEWVVQRAQEDAEFNWVGLEIRFERVYDIWSRGRFGFVENLLTLGGDARPILASCLPPGVLHRVYINFPEPPVWEQSKMVLLNAAFYTNVHRCLKPGGRLVLLTDDEGVCTSSVRELACIPKLFASSLPDAAPFVTKVPAGYGSSYFDRLWTNGDRKKRFFLEYTKLNNGFTPALPAPAPIPTPDSAAATTPAMPVKRKGKKTVNF